MQSSLLQQLQQNPIQIYTSDTFGGQYKLGRMTVYHLTKIPQTMDISRAVGTIRNNTACNMNVIPLIRN